VGVSADDDRNAVLSGGDGLDFVKVEASRFERGERAKMLCRFREKKLVSDDRIPRK
jgi:hypothetical protein